MITKDMVINEILAEVREDVDFTTFDRLKTVLIVKLHNFDIVEMQTALSTKVR